jgi:predicted kinase
MKKPKMIFLNGFAGCGKSTLSKRYIDDHQLALGFEGDELIAMFGQWRSDWEKSAELKLIHTKNIVKTHLELGYDVVLPFLLQNIDHVEEYVTLTSELDVGFYEFYLDVPKDQAIERLLQRGSWGEPDSPPFVDSDAPKINSLFERMALATATRKGAIKIQPVLGDIESTYQEILSHLD